MDELERIKEHVQQYLDGLLTAEEAIRAIALVTHEAEDEVEDRCLTIAFKSAGATRQR